MTKKTTTESHIDELNAEADILLQKYDFKQAMDLSSQAYSLAVKHKYTKGTAEALLAMGLSFLIQQENLKAREVFMQAYKIIVTMDDKPLLHNIYSRLAVTYGQLHLNDECIDYLTKTLEVSKATKNDKTIAVDYINLSTALVQMKNYPQAIISLNKAMTYAKKTSAEQLQVVILSNLSRCCRLKGDYEVSLRYAFDALEITDEHNETRNVIYIYHDITASTMSLKRLDEAEKYAHMCLSLANKYNVTPVIISTELLQAEICLLQEKYEKAKEILQNVAKLPSFEGDIEAVYKYYDLYLKICEATADYKKAYELHINLMDFDKKQAEANFKIKLDTQELKLTLKS